MANRYSLKFEADVPVLMRDGTKTYADVYRPDAPGRFPALLTRTPYDKMSPPNRSTPLDPINAAMSGYAVVVQDVRGRYASEGEFSPLFQEIDDGYDSVEWVGGQSWCTGKVGMYSISYAGATQWLAAKAKPPSLAAIVPGMTASDYHEGWTWQGGAFELGFNLTWAMGALVSDNWANLEGRLGLSAARREAFLDSKDDLAAGMEHLPLNTYAPLQDGLAPWYYEWLAHPEYDDYWKRISIEESHGEIEVPALNVGGWHDIFMGGTLRNFVRMREMGATEDARRGQRLVVGPWVHERLPSPMPGQHYFGIRASANTMGLQPMILRFFDYWVKGEDNGLMDEKPVRIFVMGENVWRLEDEWPLARAETVPYYLHSQGKANTAEGDGTLSPEAPASEPPDVYAYNPSDPVPTTGGGLCCDPIWMAWGVYDQRPAESRHDVLVYSTPPMEQDTEVTGPVTATLYASSSAPDTDFTAKLVDVDPCGYARNLTDGIIRARYRKPKAPASLIEPGRVYEYTIDLWATSNVFKKGHRIRLEISSSNFPRFDRNTNTGGPIGKEDSFVSALQTVFHTSEHPSHVTLPLVPR